jgi:transcriptional regulator with AAA-type ATPase domain
VLFIDEVHRFSKTQQDSLLAAVEDRTVTRARPRCGHGPDAGTAQVRHRPDAGTGRPYATVASRAV